MKPLTGARLAEAPTTTARLETTDGHRLHLWLLAEGIGRLLVERPDGLRAKRTWSIETDTAPLPFEGRERMSVEGLSPQPLTVEEDEARITLTGGDLRVVVDRAPVRLAWFRRTGAGWSPLVEDRPTQALLFDRRGSRFAHYVRRAADERVFGLGEKSGDMDRTGRRLRMAIVDAMGYDAETSDPLYKQIPFCMIHRACDGVATGLFYDNLAPAAFDLGAEIDAYHGDYRSFAAEDGDLDLYVIAGPTPAEVTKRFLALTGRTTFGPRWSFRYSGSTMAYTEAEDAQARLGEFLKLCAQHDIPCGSFQLSSGYTSIAGKRYVFNWNHDKFPDPRRLAADFAAADMRLAANIKPAMLLDHPRLDEVRAFGGFIRDADADVPATFYFWGGDAHHLDFTNPATVAWWKGEVKRQLLDLGIAATWNDNNECEIADDAARCHGFGEETPLALMRALQPILMMRASMEAQAEHAPDLRPFLISRAGGPGLQRYAQTWTGDNRTAWKTLRYNLRMGHGCVLSGLYNFGHDIGGFAGPRPDPELFVRWVQQGVFLPRFTIHSWNDDGSVNEPWMHAEVLPIVRDFMHLRERLVPLLYTLAWRAHTRHEPIVAPTLWHFPHDAGCWVENDEFMLGESLLVAPVVEQGATSRRLYLPACPEGWCELDTGAWHAGGQTVSVDAPLERCPVFVRGGHAVPLGPSPADSSGTLTWCVYASPVPVETATVVFDDDGLTHGWKQGAYALLTLAASVGPDAAKARLTRRGPLPPRWTSVEVVGVGALAANRRGFERVARESIATAPAA
ncbi:glycoside hydrolase family 31 protein [Chelatococcus sp. SYSU_G07232]|uniref:Glycoside hydrolase family 31 protein n=1 Tax=Chelatococcus albus TaxID=3047466 RepID=A0ABT7ALB8_9HYPH|nr:glycoside hydrolase family 31 protein [Chelatococcus sp. SYSU_G07232]MDJ1160173.1 glycoside hydrolase family 31 protein [Chelatococcus sp. SYSU_G07232]